MSRTALWENIKHVLAGTVLRQGPHRDESLGNPGSLRFGYGWGFGTLRAVQVSGLNVSFCGGHFRPLDSLVVAARAEPQAVKSGHWPATGRSCILTWHDFWRGSRIKMLLANEPTTQTHQQLFGLLQAPLTAPAVSFLWKRSSQNIRNVANVP